MSLIKDLQIKHLAQMFLPEIVESHGFGFFDGGCFTFAQAVHLAFPDVTKTVLAVSREGVIHHGLVKIKGQDMYGDADGWQSLEAFKRNFLAREGVAIDAVVDANFATAPDDWPVVLYDDILSAICQHIEYGRRISIELPVGSHYFIWIECGLFGAGRAGVTSSVAPDCEGAYGGFAEGVESMVLGHFCAGVDVVSAEYCEGVSVALEAAANNMPECHCDACVRDLAEEQSG